MNTIADDIKSGTFHSAYLVFGPESYLARYHKNRLIAALGGRDSMNFKSFSGKGIDVHELIDLAEMMPLFADHRLILIEDSDLFESKNDSLIKYMEEIPESTVLLFVQESVDKRGRLYKAIQKNGVICECERQKSAYLEKFIAGYLNRAGKRITRYTLDLFLKQVGNDMELLAHEMDKLISYSEGRGVIEPEDVETVCTVNLESKIYHLTDAISSHDPNRTMKLYHELTEQEMVPMQILSGLVNQFRQLLRVKELSGRGMRSEEIAKKLKIHSYSAGIAVKQCRAFSRTELKSAVADCLKFEELFKNGRIDANTGLEMLLIRYSTSSSDAKPLFCEQI
ncbi:MAG: DNA polymerase III subunit delta [Lachnospiraceae bacterium]|nr:DNA polymerase III subunit delta [Lachnospiraceae bacterium]